MKTKSIILAALCAVTFCANAQTEKGKMLLNGSVGYSSNKTTSSSNNSSNYSFNDDKTRALRIMPRIGYFVSNNWAIGIGVGYDHEKINTSNYSNVYPGTFIIAEETKQQIFNVGPFLRYYVDIAEKFKFFGQFNAEIGFGKTEQDIIYSTFNGSAYVVNSNNTEFKTATYSTAINPGFAFFPSKKWAIEFSFPLLSYYKIEPKDQQNTSRPTLEAFTFAADSFNPSIGFNFHF